MKRGEAKTVNAGMGPAGIQVVLLSILLLCTFAGARSQDLYSIRWIGQFPALGDDQTPSFGERISKLVFGTKSREVIKPFNIVAVDPGHYWVLDQGAGGVFEIQEGEGRLVRSMKKAGDEFPSLVGICRIPGGDLICTDSRLNRIIRIGGGGLSTLADSIAFDQPTGITYNRVTGEIWVVETGSHRISLINGKGELIRRIGKRGTAPGSFNFPTFIWTDPAGNVYIVDSMNFRVQILDREGFFLGTFGESGDATGYMARPKGVATDSEGNIYVADALFHAVQIFDREGRFLYSFGRQGQDKGEFWMPAGIFIDEQDFIYVADSYNGRIQVFQLVRN